MFCVNAYISFFLWFVRPLKQTSPLFEFFLSRDRFHLRSCVDLQEIVCNFYDSIFVDKLPAFHFVFNFLILFWVLLFTRIFHPWSHIFLLYGLTFVKFWPDFSIRYQFFVTCYFILSREFVFGCHRQFMGFSHLQGRRDEHCGFTHQAKHLFARTFARTLFLIHLREDFLCWPSGLRLRHRIQSIFLIKYAVFRGGPGVQMIKEKKGFFFFCLCSPHVRTMNPLPVLLNYFFFFNITTN